MGFPRSTWGLTRRHVCRYPWRTHESPTCVVEVDVSRFEPVEGKRVELVADVGCSRTSDSHSTRHRERIEIALTGTDGAAVAKAMGAALAELAGKIAAQVESMGGVH